MMRHLLNTLFVTSEDIYLSLDGENIVANQNQTIVARYPLHILSGVISFSYSGASPALMGACTKRGISMAFCTPNGRFLARVTGENNGNVLLRKTQYRISDDPEKSCKIARTMIYGKIYNARSNIQRTLRDHRLRVDAEKLDSASSKLKSLLPEVLAENNLDRLRGLEGSGATTYFDVFPELILGDTRLFAFKGRSRRPPLDPINALLSFSYSLLSYECASALESVGMDAYVGFLHRDRPGRSSLALDMMEELRPCIAERFVLSLINNRMLNEKDFQIQPSGALLLTDEARKAILKHWQQRKTETLTHPYLKEKIPWGMVPYVQALLLSRYLRGDLEEYPPFLWK